MMESIKKHKIKLIIAVAVVAAVITAGILYADNDEGSMTDDDFAFYEKWSDAEVKYTEILYDCEGAYTDAINGNMDISAARDSCINRMKAIKEIVESAPKPDNDVYEKTRKETLDLIDETIIVLSTDTVTESTIDKLDELSNRKHDIFMRTLEELGK